MMQQLKNKILIPATGDKLLYDVFFKQNNVQKPVVIYVHGFNGFKDWGNFDLIASAFAQAGYFFIKFNLSHNGTTIENPEDFTDLEAYGNNNYTTELNDTQAIINWVCDKNNLFSYEINTQNITLLGHSRGGGIAILKAFEDKRIKQLVTWASVSVCQSPWNQWSAEKMAEWKQTGVQYYSNKRTQQEMPLYYQLFLDYEQNKKRLDIQQAISKLTIPILICHGTQDEAVPFSNALLLQQWQPNAQLFPIQSNHVFDRTHPYLLSTLPDAMQKVLDETILFLNKFAH